MPRFLGTIFLPTGKTSVGGQRDVKKYLGKDVTRFKEGEKNFPGLGFGLGAYAQYTCLPEESEDGVMAFKPANVSYDEAATIPTGGLESLHFLREANIREGERLLINGAKGSIGTYRVQLANPLLSAMARG